MRIVHIAIEHPPFDVRVFHKQAHTLALAGYDVHIVTGGSDEVVRDGVRFHGIGARTPPRRRLWRRAAAVGAGAKRLWGAYRAARRLRGDVYHVHEPNLVVVGSLLRRGGVRVIYDAHEDYRGIAARKYRSQPIVGGVLWVWYSVLEWVAERWLDQVVTATPAIARRFRDPKIVHNYPLLGEFTVDSADRAGRSARQVAYVGGISEIRGAREMVRAMELLGDRPGARLVLAGKFQHTGLEDQLRREPGWAYVEFVGWRSREQSSELMRRSAAGLVLFHPAPNHTEALPNKLFEYMAAGVPVIASDFPLWRSIVADAGCGLVVDPRDPAAIADAIGWVLDHPTEARAMGLRGREAVQRTYNWNSQAAVLLGIYRSVGSPSRAELPLSGPGSNSA